MMAYRSTGCHSYVHSGERISEQKYTFINKREGVNYYSTSILTLKMETANFPEMFIYNQWSCTV
jgi:hypothetical protein